MASNPESTLRRPAFVLPAGACDSHCHIWGPVAAFPFAPATPYTPPERDKHVLRALYRRLGVERSVVVQPIVYGSDCRAMLDAIADDPEHYRGVALIDESTDDAQLARLHAAGVRGVRFGFVKHLRASPDLGFFRRTAARIASLGWHLQLHLDASQLTELGDELARLRAPFVIDHMGRVDAAGGVSQPAFRELLALASRQNCWVKLSGADRVSALGAPFRDVVPLAQALMAVAPDRVLWGTDFPHPNPRHDVADDADLVDLLPLIADTRALDNLLVHNPARLYGFPDRAVPAQPR